jgi:PKD repeat protein
MKSGSCFQPSRIRAYRFLPLICVALICCSNAQQLETLSTPSRLRKVRISDPTLARQVSKKGGELIADYGGFSLFLVPEAVAAEIGGRVGFEDENHQNQVELNSGRLDTTSPDIQALRIPLETFSGKRLHLLQFAGPVTPEWRAELEKTGVAVVSYVPQNTYLVYGTSSALNALQAWAQSAAYVQWEGKFLDDYKIHPRARPLDNKGRPQRPGTDLFAIQLVADADANPATLQVLDRLKLEPVRRQARVLGFVNVILRLNPERLNEIAAQPDVISIQPYFERRKMDERQDQIMAGNLNGSQPAGPGYLAWLASKGFTQAQFNASGFAVDVSDSGIDNGSTAPGHFGLYQVGNPGQGSRVIYNRLEGTPNPGSTLQGCDGHGTLNTHIIAGYNDRPNGFPHTDSLGFHYGLGVCPFANVGSSVIFDPDSYTYPNFTDLQSRAYNNGARISNNSWGADNAGAYDIDAQEYDALVRDAQPAGAPVSATGNQEMVIVFAAGNAGPDTGSVGSPGTAKNVITVGAAENVRSLAPANGGNDPLGNDGCSVPDSGANSANDLVSFSSRGPCTDGRVKPDIVAPGTHVTGGVAQNSPPPSPSSIGSALPCFSATGVCGLPGGGTAGNQNDFFPLGQQFFSTSSGTSHSTPAVAGSCALVRQFFINQGRNAPSPAMTKAWLLNSARYLTGVGANDSLFSKNQGMGEVNLGLAFDGAFRVVRDEVSADKFTATGQTRTFTGTIMDSSKPFRVTLAWTDAPGSTAGNAYNNNLDLVVSVGGNTYKGNVFSGAYSTTGGVADSKNNVESVFLPAGLSGNFVVTVIAANINSDGVPNEAPALDQDFALVIYNGAQANGPVILADSYAVAAESCVPTNNAVDPNETVTINVALRNIGTTNTANLVATLLPTGGVSSVSGPQTYGALAANGPAATQPFSFTAAGACGTSIAPTFQLQDGTTNLGQVTLNIPLGQTLVVLTQNFDTVTAPNLPSGWTTSTSGTQPAWVTSTAQAATAPNAAFSGESASPGVNELDSPPITIAVNSPQLSFQHTYNMEPGYDGGVLEIKIGAGAFTDILSAGGVFVSGAYTDNLSDSTGNPLGGRQAWTGNSGGFVTTLINLPAIAVGQIIQLRWRCGTDHGTAGNGWYVDNVSVSGLVCCGSTVPLLPLAQPVSTSVTAESCSPANGAPDPGETVTVNIGVQNIGAGNSSNLVATLLATNGISSPSGPQVYGSLLAGGPVVSRPFSFLAVGSCGDTISPTLHFQDGPYDLGTLSLAMNLGQLSIVLTQNFDGVIIPNLPSGWTTSSTNTQTPWVTTNSLADSPPNSAFSGDAANIGVNQLVTPVISLPAKPARLTFRNNYDLEASSGSLGYDGGVLEIKIGSGAFTDIITAGGSFVSGGYSRVISSSYGNPLAGRQAWSGNSGGFITTAVNLPAAASGQQIQLRWRCGSDSSTATTGWYIDSISITAPLCCGNVDVPIAAFTAAPLVGNVPLSVTFTDSSTGTITNRQWSFGNGATTNTTATNFVFVYGAPGTDTVSLTVSGPIGVSTVVQAGYVTATNPVPLIVSNSFALAVEGCPNGAIDPGETVTVNVGLKNLGNADTVNLVGTLQNSGGVTPLSAPQTYGIVTHGGAAVTLPFTFLASGLCGGSNVATLALQDGPQNLGTIAFPFVLGQIPVFAEAFDGVTAPALPTGWTSSATNAQVPWVTSTSKNLTPPNAAFSPDAAAAGVNALVTPLIALPGTATQLSFSHWYDLEAASSGTVGYDGGVLEIKIGSGAFTDILAAGGSFVGGGYNHTLSSSFGNPLAGRQAWSGQSGAFVSTVINLPSAALGQSVQFRWRCGSDSSTATTGWYLDNVSLSTQSCCTNGPSITTQPLSQTVLAGSSASLSVTAAGTAPLNYQWLLFGTNLSGATASTYALGSAQPANAGPYKVVVVNSVGSVTSSVATLSVVNRPILLSPSVTNGNFSFILSGDAGFNYSIEATTNFGSWTAVGTLSNASGLVPFTETNTPAYRFRAYRARLLP